MYCSYKWNRKNKTTTNTWSAPSNALPKPGSWSKVAVQAVDVAELPQKGPLGPPTITIIAVRGGKNVCVAIGPPKTILAGRKIRGLMVYVARCHNWMNFHN
jgi:hypothetical protein